MLPHCDKRGFGRQMACRHDSLELGMLFFVPPIRHETLQAKAGTVLLLISFHKPPPPPSPRTQTSGSSGSIHFLLLMLLPSQTFTLTLCCRLPPHPAIHANNCLIANNSQLTKSRASCTTASRGTLLSRRDQSGRATGTTGFIRLSGFIKGSSSRLFQIKGKAFTERLPHRS